MGLYRGRIVMDALQIQVECAHKAGHQIGHQTGTIGLVEAIQRATEAIVIELLCLIIGKADGAAIDRFHPGRQLVERFFADDQVVTEQYQGIDYRDLIIAVRGDIALEYGSQPHALGDGVEQR